jgi:hypothetical protein
MSAAAGYPFQAAYQHQPGQYDSQGQDKHLDAGRMDQRTRRH